MRFPQCKMNYEFNQLGLIQRLIGSMMTELSNAHRSAPPPEGLARGTLALLDKRLSGQGLTFDCKAYIDEQGAPCVQVYVDNDDDPDDKLDMHYQIDDDTPDELYALIREELEEIYDLQSPV